MTSLIDVEVEDYPIEMKLKHNPVYVQISMQKDNYHQKKMQQIEKKEVTQGTILLTHENQEIFLNNAQKTTT